MPRIHFHDIDVPREKAKALRDELRAAGFPGTRLMAAQKVVALVYGYSSWAELRRTIQSCPRRDDMSTITMDDVLHHLLELVAGDHQVANRVASAVRFADACFRVAGEGCHVWDDLVACALSIGATDVDIVPGERGIDVMARSAGVRVPLRTAIPVETYDLILDHVVRSCRISTTPGRKFGNGEIAFQARGRDFRMRVELVPVSARSAPAGGRWFHALLTRVLWPDGSMDPDVAPKARKLRDACWAETREIEMLPEVVAIRNRWHRARESLGLRA